MADFALWCEAIARALGYKDLEFIKVYNDNIGKQNIEVMESNTLGQAISRFLSTWYNPERPACWFGTTSDFLDKLTKIALEYNINLGSKSWPKAANSLSRRLKSILSNIREGLEFELSITRNTTGKYKGVSAVKVWKITSPSLPSSPDQNHTQNQDHNGEDTKGGDDLYPHQADEPSLKNHQNRAQNIAGERSEGSEDTYRTFSTSTVYRLGSSDIFACRSCKQRGDIHYLKDHICSGKK
jgi:hypothetical protein